MKKEEMYDFRKRLLQIHEPNIRNDGFVCPNDFYMLRGKVKIGIESVFDEVIVTAARDFCLFLRTSMAIDADIVCGGDADIRVISAKSANKDMGSFASYKGFITETDESGITIYAHDSRGAASALYYIEDKMTFIKAPAYKFGTVKNKPMFSPMMVHSVYGLDEYPDEYLSRIAHEGRDAILVFTKDVNLVPSGYLDFNDLIKRAARYGIDVYAYSYIKAYVSPESEEADEFYENTYGRLFRLCPKLKGVTLVGESVEFPSKDPHIAPGRHREIAKDGIPADKPSAGWYPCYDYPIWLNLVKSKVRKYNPDADIVFWTYNWGYHSEEERVKLIESLPTDISLQATFEMFEILDYENSKGKCADYTLSFAGPGKYFESEAKAAKKRGIRLYSMTNTGGRTWDFGTAPYEPMPYQWMKRYEGMRAAHDNWGLSGIMETHHYGFYPSFISKLSKHAFSEPYEPMEDILKEILISEYGSANYEYADKALRLFSEGITHYTPSNADQYGAYRVGPAYPFNLGANMNIPEYEGAMFGNRICEPKYRNRCDVRISPLSIRIKDELAHQEKMLSLFEEGLKCLSEAPERNEKLCELENLCHFLKNCALTGVNTKKWHVLICKMDAEDRREELLKIYSDMEALLRCEEENVKDTIPLVEADSSLGFEPSMLYMTDKWHLEWKLRQLKYVIDAEIGGYRKSLAL